MAGPLSFGVPVKTVQFDIVSKNAEQRRVYGWAMLSRTKSGKPVVDLQGDIVEPQDLEDAAANFLREARVGGEMHKGSAHSDLIASLVTTPEIVKALGLPEGQLPVGWFVGFEVLAELFSRVKQGSRLAFSIEGEAETEPVEVAA